MDVLSLTIINRAHGRNCCRQDKHTPDDRLESVSQISNVSGKGDASPKLKHSICEKKANLASRRQEFYFQIELT